MPEVNCAEALALPVDAFAEAKESSRRVPLFVTLSTTAPVPFATSEIALLLNALAVAAGPVAIATAPTSAELPAALTTDKATGPAAAGPALTKICPVAGVLTFDVSAAAPEFFTPMKHSGEAVAIAQIVIVSVYGAVVSTTLVPA